MTTLYERWRTVAQEHRNEAALRDLTAGKRWTFAALAREAEAQANPAGPIAFPQGTGAPFILTVLRAWRAGQIVCPLEPDQPPPSPPWPSPPIVHLKLTSATTGAARLIAFTAEQLAADAAHLVPTMGLRPDWPNLGVISLAHSYGFSNLVTPLLLHGIPLVLGASALPEAVRKAARGYDALTLAAVPALWRAWHEAQAIPRPVRLAISAGAPLPLALEEAVHAATGLKIHNFYGSSECGGIAYDRTLTPRSEAALAGSPVDHVQLQVNADGCLVVRGPNVGTGYWPQPLPTLGGGAYTTSDRAELRGSQLLLLGRAGDVIHVAGRKVAPETVEQALLQHPAVRETVVLGLPLPGERGEAIAAVVVPRHPLDEQVLRQFLLERLPAWKVPRLWRFVNDPLSNDRGKISRAEWRRCFLRPE